MVKKGAMTMIDAKGQDRLDRLEKLTEEMFAGIAQLRETQAAYTQERREDQRKIDEEILALKESQAKTDEQMRRTDAKLDHIGKQLGDLGFVQGEVAEELFFRNLRGVFRKTKMDLAPKPSTDKPTSFLFTKPSPDAQRQNTFSFS